MKSRLPFRKLIVAVSAVMAMPLLAVAQPGLTQQGLRKKVIHFPHYTVTDLGVLGAGTNASAFDMNAVGWVAGSSNLTAGGPQHAFVWYGHGGLKDLGTLDGEACPMCNSAADGPNLLRQTAIGSEISSPDPDGEDFCGYGTHLQCRGVVSRNGKLMALRNLPGGGNANAFGIKDWALVGFERGLRLTCATATHFRFRLKRCCGSEWRNQEIAALTKRAIRLPSQWGSTTSASPLVRRARVRCKDAPM